MTTRLDRSFARRLRTWCAVFVGTIVLACGAEVQAQTSGRWTPTTGASDGSWSNAANWVGGVVPVGGATTTLTFAATTGTTILNQNLGTPFILNQMMFIRGTGGEYTIGGGDLQFTGANARIFFQGTGAIGTGITPTFSTQTIANNLIISTSGLSLISTSTSNNTLQFTGATISTNFSGQVTLTLGGSSVGSTTGGLNAIFNQITGGPSGTISLIKADAGTWVLSNTNNTFNGNVTILNGILSASTIGNIGQASSLGAGDVIAFGAGATSGTLSLATSDTAAMSSNRTLRLLGGTGGGAVILNNSLAATASLLLNGNVVVSGSGLKPLILGGTNTGDNTLASTLTNGTGTLGLQKIGAGTWVVNNAANAFTGGVSVFAGVLRTGTGLAGINPSGNNIMFGGTSGAIAVIESNGTITNAVGTGAGQIQWRSATGGGGFAAFGGDLFLLFGNSTNTLIWGSTAGFTGTGNELMFGSATANGVVTLSNHLSLGNGVRTIRIFDNASTTADAAVLAGVVSSSGGLIITGSAGGKLVLSGTNTYSGGTSLATAVEVVVRNSSAFGTGTVTVTSGLITADTTSVSLNNLFRLNGNITFSGTQAIAINGTMTLVGGNRSIINNNTGGLTLSNILVADTSAARILTFGGQSPIVVSGIISNTTPSISSSVVISNTSAGGVTFLSNNTYGGMTTISANSILRLGGGGTVGSINSTLSMLAGSQLIVNRSDVLTLTRLMFGTGGVVVDGGPAGGLQISGTQARYTGGTTINSGTLLYGMTNVLSTLGDVTVNSSGTLNFNGFDARINGLFGSGQVVSTGTTQLTLTEGNFSGTILGSMGLRKVGPDTLVLSGSNSFSGNSSIFGGTIVVGNNQALGTANWLVSFQAGSGTSTLMTDGTARTLANNFTLSGDLVLSGTAPFTLTGNVSTFDARTLFVNSTGTNVMNTITLNPLASNDSLTIAGDQALIVNGVISQLTATAGSVVITNTAGVIFGANNTYTGMTTVESGARLTLGTRNGTLGNVAGGIFLNSGTLTFDYANTAVLTKSINGIGDVIINSGPSGGIRFDTQMAYIGTTTVQQGTLLYGNANAIDPSGTLSINSTGTFTLNGFDAAITNLYGSGAINNLSSTSAVFTLDTGNFSGVISGTNLGLVKTGNGILQLSGANTFGGVSTLLDGTIIVGNNSALGLSTGAIWSVISGTFSGDGTAREIANRIELNGDLTIGGTSFLYVSNSLTNAFGDRTLAVTNTGGTQFQSIHLTESTTIGRTFTLDIYGPTTFNGIITDGALTNTNTSNNFYINLHSNATLTFNGNNSYRSPTTISGNGTTVVTSVASLSTGVINVVAGANLRMLGTSAGDVNLGSGYLSGTGTINGVVNSTNGVISPGDGGVGQLNVKALNLYGGILKMELGAINSTFNSDHIRITGTAAPTNTGPDVLFDLVPLVGQTAGTYWLITGFTGQMAQSDLDRFKANVPIGYLSNPVFGSNIVGTNGMVGISLRTATGSILTWTGGGAGGVWDDGITANWLTPSNTLTTYNDSANFSAGNDVIFGDLPQNQTVTVNNFFTPNGFLINNNVTTYTFKAADFAGIFANGLNITKSGVGLAIFDMDVITSGFINISQGTLQFGTGGTNGMVFSDDGLFPGTIFDNGVLSINRGTDFIFNTTIIGTGDLIKSGTGTMMITAAQSYYTGNTTILQGVLSASGGGVLSGTGKITVLGGTLDINAQLAAQNLSNVTVSNGGRAYFRGSEVYIGTLALVSGTAESSAITTLNLSATNLSFGGGGFGTKGVLTLTGANSTLTVRNINYLAGGGTATNDPLGGLLNRTNTGGRIHFSSTNSQINVADSKAVDYDLTVSVPIETPYIKTGAGALYLTGPSVYTGTATLNGGSIVIGHTNALGMGALSVTSGMLRADGTAQTITNVIVLRGSMQIGGTSNLTFATSVSGATITGTLVSAGTNTLMINNSGMTTFSNIRPSNLYITGTGDVSIGRITLGGSGTITFSGNNNVYLNGPGTHSVGRVTEGIVRFSDSTALGSNIQIGFNSQLVTPELYATQSMTLARPITVLSSSAASVHTFGIETPITLDVTGQLSLNRQLNVNTVTGGVVNFRQLVTGGAGITITGGGTAQLTASNNYSGTTIVHNGLLRLGATRALGVGTTLQVNVGSTLDLNGASITITTLNNGASGGGRIGSYGFSGVTTLSVAAGTFGGVIEDGTVGGVVELVKRSASSLTLAGDNTYSGATTIALGTVFIGSGAFGSIISPTISFANTTTTGIAVVAFNRSDNISYSGVIMGTGSLLKNGAGRLILSGNSTYDGVTTIAAGVLQIGNGGTSGSITSDNVKNRGVLAFNRSDTLQYDGLIELNGALSILTGTVVLTADHTFTGITTIAPGSALMLGNSTTGGSLNLNAVNNGLLIFNRSTDLTWDGIISGTGALDLRQSNLTLTNNSTYSGGTTIGAGLTLQLGVGLTTGMITGSVANSGLLVFNRNNTGTFAGSISGTGGVRIDDGTIIFTQAQTYSGFTTIATGEALVLTGQGALTGSVNNSGLLTFDSSSVYGGSVQGSGDVLFASGVTTFSNNNTYSGATTINSGAALNLTGTLANTPSVFVAGTLQGSGRVTVGTVTVQSTGLLDPGGSGTIATLTLANLILNGGSLNFDLAGAGASDLLRITGGLPTISSNVILNLTGLAGFTTGSYTLMSGYSGQLGATDFAFLQAPTTLSGLSLSLQNSNGALNLVVGASVSSNLIWTGLTSTNWDFATANNWSPVQTFTNDDVVTFNDTAATFTVNITPTQVSPLTIAVNTNTGAYVFVGGDLHSGELVKNGTSTLTFLTNASFTSGVTLFGGTLQIGNGSSALGSLTGNIFNNGLVQFGRVDAYTYDGVISSTGGVQIISGTTIFTGSHSYTGGTTINPGTRLQLGNGGASGSIIGSVTNSGVLAFRRSDAYTFGSVVSGNGALSVLTGTVILTADQSYTGPTSIAAGAALHLGNGGTTGLVVSAITNSGVLNFNLSSSTAFNQAITGSGAVGILSGTLAYTTAQTYTGVTTIASGANLILGGAAGSLSGSVSNAGVLTMNRTLSYGGIINGAGTVLVQSGTTTFLTNQLYTGPTVIASGAALNLGGGGATGSIASLNVTNTGTLIFNLSGATVYGGVISGPGGVSIATGTVTLTANQAYTGVTTIAPGTTLNVGIGATTGQLAGNVANAGVLSFNRSDTNSYGSVISGTGSVLKLGGGTLILTGANTYTGITTIAAGVLQIGNGGAAGALLSPTVTNSSLLVFNRSDAIGFGGLVAGSGGLTVLTGTVSLTQDNTYSGGTTIASGAALFLGNSTASGSVAGNITNGGFLAFNRTNPLTFAGVISSTGGVSILSNTVTFVTNQTYSGITTIASGATLNLGNGGTTGSVVGGITNSGVLNFNFSDSRSVTQTIIGSGAVGILSGTITYTGFQAYTGPTTIASGANLIIGGPSGNLGGNISNFGLLTFNNSITYGGVISGTGAVNILAGTLQLTNANTYTGVTTIAASANLILGGASGNLTGDVTNSGLLTLSHTLTYGGVISGPGAVLVQGGTVTLTNNQLYTGPTTIAASAGLVIGSGASGSLASNVFNSGALSFSNSGSSTYGGVISGNGTVSVLSGTLTFTDAQTYTGITSIGSGANLVLGGSASNLAGNVSVSSGGLLTIAHTMTYTGVISGGGGLQVIGGNVATLTGTSTYSGPTTVDGAFLVVNGGLGSTTVSVLGGGELQGLGTIGGSVNVASNGSISGSLVIGGQLNSSGTINPGAAGVLGTLRMTSLILNGGSLNFDLFTNTSGNFSDRLIVNGGSFSVSNTTFLNFNNLGGLTTGSYSLITGYAGSLTATDFSRLSTSGFFGGFAISLTHGSGFLNLIVSNIANQTLTWNGSTNSLWDLSSANWLGASPTFTNGISNVIFDNSTLTNNVTVTISGVNPQSMVVNNDGSHQYIFSTGGIVSNTLLKQGVGTLIFGNDVTFTGGAVVAAGILQIGNNSGNGSFTGNITNSSQIDFRRSDVRTFTGVISGTGVVTTASGTLIFTADQTYTGVTSIINGALQLGNGGTTGYIPGLITMTNGVLVFNRSNTVLRGGNDITGNGAVSILTGTLTYTGDQSYTGPTTIAAAATLNLGTGGTVGMITGGITNSGVLNFNFSDSRAIAQNIIGGGAVGILSGTITYTGAQSYTGVTTITPNAHLILGGSAGNLTGNVVNQNLLTISRSLTYGGTISSTGSVLIVGGTTVTFTNNQSYTGATTVGNGSILNLGVGSASGTFVGNITNSGVVNININAANNYGGVISGTGAVAILSGTTTFTGGQLYSGVTTINSGATLVLGGAAGNVLGNIQDEGVLTFSRTMNVGNLISGGGAVRVFTGTTTFTGNQLYTGVTTIHNGAALNLGTGGASGSIVGNVTNSGFLNFNLNTTTTYDGLISGTGAVNIVTGTVVLTAAHTYTGITTIFSGANLVLGGASGNLTGTISNAGLLSLAHTLTYTNRINGAGAVEVRSGAIVTLTNINTYTGATTVNGMLVINGATASLGATPVSIMSGGELRGDGVIGGTVNVNTGGVLSGSLQINARVFSQGSINPGGNGTIGVLTMSSLVLNGGTLNFDIFNTTIDQISILTGGGLIINNTTAFNFTNLGGLTSGSYLLIGGYSGSLTTTDFSRLTAPSTLGGFNLSLTHGAGSLSLIVSTILSNNLVWTGSNSSTWDTTTINWTGDATTFTNGFSNVQFDNSSSVNNITVTAAGVQPRSMVFNNDGSHNYLFTNGAIVSDTMIKQGVGRVTFANAVTLSNGVAVQGGFLQIGNGGTVGSLVGDVLNNAQVDFRRSDTYIFSNSITGTGAVTHSGGTLVLVGNSNYSGMTSILSGTLQIGNGGASGGITGNVFNAGTLVYNRSDLATYGGVVSGSGSVSVATGTLVLTANQTYTGATTIASGATLNLGNGGASGLLAGSITNSGVLNFNLSGSNSVAQTIIGSGAVGILSGTVSYTGAQLYTGVTTIASGANLIFSGTGSVVAGITNNGLLTLNRTLTMGNVVGGSGALLVASGTAALSGTSTYNGPTTIASGAQLVVNGGLGATAVTIQSGGELRGLGTLGGAVTVASGGTLSGSLTINAAVTSSGSLTPGGNNVIGALRMSSLVLNGGTLNFDIFNTTSDQLLILGGGLNVNGTTAFNFTNLGGLTTGTYTLITGYNNTLSALELSRLTAPLSLSGMNLSLTHGSGFLNLIVSNVSSNNLVWSGTNSATWDTTTINWSGDATTFTNNVSNVVFNNSTSTNTITVTAAGVGPQSMVVNNDGSHNYLFSGGSIVSTSTLLKQGVGQLTFANDVQFNGGVFVTGGILQIGNGGTVGSLTGNITNSAQVNFRRSDSYTYAGVISGTGAVTHSGGTLVFTGTNTYSGLTSILSGTLQIGNGGTVGQVAGSIANFGNLVFNRSDAITYGGVISGTGAVNLLSGTLTFTDAQTYTGVTTIASGANLILGGSAGNLTGSVGNAGLLTMAHTLSYGGVISGNGGVLISTGSTTFSANQLYTGVTTIASGAGLNLGVGGATGMVVGDITNSGLLNFNYNTTQTYGGLLSGTGGVNVFGGTLVVTSNNNFTGNTTIAPNATLQIGVGTLTGRIQGTITNNGLLVYQKSGNSTQNVFITGTGSVLIASGFVTFGQDQQYTGITTINPGAGVQLGTSGSAGNLAGDVVNNGQVFFVHNSTPFTYSGVISGTGAVQLFASTLTYTKAQTYTGVTLLEAGSNLILSGSGNLAGNVNNTASLLTLNHTLTYGGVIFGNGDVLVNSGIATFLSNQTYTGITTIAAGATLNAGVGGATGSILSNVTNSGALNFNINATTVYGGVISGNGGVGVLTGTVTFTNNQLYTGQTTIFSGAVVNLGIGGATGTIASNVTNSGLLNFNVNAANTYGGVISGTGAVAVLSGITTFTNNQTYTGVTSISGGAQLNVGNGGTTGQLAGNVFDAGVLSFNRSDTNTYAGIVSGVGSVLKNGGGTLILTGANTYTGVTTIAAGVIQIGNGGTVGSILSQTVANSGVLAFNRSDAVVYGGLISGTGGLSVLSGTVGLTRDNTFTGPTTIASGATLNLGNGTAAGSVVGNVVNGGLLTFNRTSALSYGGVISSTGSVSVLTSTATFTANQTYSGATTIASGATLNLGNGGASGMIAGNVTDSGLLNFNLSGSNTFAQSIIGSGGVGVLTGTLNFVSNQAYTGPTTIFSGATLNLGNGGAAGLVAGNITDSGLVNFNFNTTQTYGGAIGGSGAAAFLGGTVALSGTSTYNGPTTIASGAQLVVNGGLGATAVTIQSGGELRGLGTLGGAVTVANGGALSGSLTINAAVTSSGSLNPGGSGVIGALRMSSLVLNGGTLNFDIFNTTSDQLLILGGGLNVNGTTAFNFTNLGGLTTGTYSLISGYNNTLSALEFSRLTSPLTFSGMNFTLTHQAGQLSLIVSNISSNNLVWTGSSNNGWDTVAANWTGGATTFTNNVSNVTFNNISSVNSITVATLGVQPQSMVVNNDGSHNYLFSGGSIVSTSTLLKQGVGQLTFANDVQFNGGAVINGGVLNIGNGTGSGSFTGNIVNNALVNFNRTGTLTYAGNMTGTGDVTKQGSGQLILTGASSFGGGLTIFEGNLTVSNGGTLTSSVGMISRSSGIAASATISGAGSRWTATAGLTVGFGGPGTLTVTNGGQMVTNAASVGNGLNVGSVIISGVGSSMTVSDIFDVGFNNAAAASQILIENGGQIVAREFNVGVWSGNGVAVVTGAGSKLTVTDDLQIGWISPFISGTAALTVTGGGQVASNNAYVGLSAGFQSTAIVSGTGSQLAVTNLLTVGERGTGTLSILNGGQVISRTATVGGDTIGVGTIIVSGTGSQWSITNNLYLGGNATSSAGLGALSVNAGGAVNIGGLATLYSTGSLTVGSGGSFTAGSLTGTGGIFNNGAVAIGSDGTSTTYSGAITGAGTLTKTGGGVFTMVGASTYTGGTAVNGGSLIVNGSLGASTVAVASGAILGGNGTLGGPVNVAAGGLLTGGLTINNAVTAAGAITPGTVGTVSTMTLASLILNGATLNFDIGTNTIGNYDRLRILGAAPTVSTTAAFNLSQLAGFGVGTYNLLSGYSGTIGNFAGLSFNAFGGYSMTLQNNSGSLDLIVAALANRVWAGGNGIWDRSTPNFQGPSTYADGNAVSFLSTGTSNNITVTSSGVLPGTMTVSNDLASPYTFSGGSIGGSTYMLKQGVGSLTFSNTNTYSGPTSVLGGVMTIGGGGSITNSGGVFVSNAQLTVASGGAINGGGQTIISNSGTVTNNGSISGLVTVNSGGTFKGNGGTVGAVVVNSGGWLSPGNSVGTLTINGAGMPSNAPSLTLNAGANIVFEFNNATGTFGGAGVGGWDYIDLGTGVLNLNARNTSATDRVNLYIDSLKLADNLHGAASNFNTAIGTTSSVQQYFWKFVGLTDSSKIVMTGDTSINGRFHIIDNAANMGVFDLTNGNPFTRPVGALGQGTFKVLAGDYGQGYGLYVWYSAIPEPSSMILAGLGSLAAGWYGRRRLRKKAAEAAAAATTPVDVIAPQPNPLDTPHA